MEKLNHQFKEADTAVTEEIEKIKAENREKVKATRIASEKQKLRTHLDKIKHDRCIFFGCIDIHPPHVNAIY